MAVPLEALLTAFVLLLALALFITEVVTVDLAALIIMALLMVLGLVTPEEGISGFANPATITVLAMFILSAGIERTGAVNLLAQRVAPIAGKGLRAQLLAIVIIVAPVSAFINNTAAVAVLLPVVLGLAKDTGTSPSKLLIPLSFASMLGGTMTLLGSSTNLLASNVSERLGHGAFGMFEFTSAGILVALLGGIYLVLVAPRLLPDRGQGAAARYNVAAYLAEVQVTANSPLVGKPLAEVRLPERYHTAVVLLRRNGMEAEPDAETRLEAGDVLVLTGDRTKLLELASLEGVTLAGEGAAHWGGGKKVQLYEVLITPRSALVGRTISDARFRSRYGGTVLALRKRARVVASHQPLARAHLDAGDALLVAGIEEDKRRVRLSDDVLLVEELGGRPFRREKAWIALLVMAGVVAVAAVGFVEILVAAIAGAALMAILGVLHMEELHAAIRWDVLFLLAGVIPLGIALERSGLAAMMAGGITAAGYFLPALAVLILVYGITTLLTEVMSNNAAVVLLAPIAAATAMALDLNPKTFLLAVTFAASTAFLTPVGYQTNTLVYGPGGYRFSDYARVGLPLNLLLLFATPVILDYFFPLYG